MNQFDEIRPYEAEEMQEAVEDSRMEETEIRPEEESEEEGTKSPKSLLRHPRGS